MEFKVKNILHSFKEKHTANCKKQYEDFLEYSVKGDIICFASTRVSEDEVDIGTVFNDFLLELSKDHQVFFYTYRLNNISYIVDENLILSKAQVLLKNDITIFHLKEAKIKSSAFIENVCESEIYYFHKSVSLYEKKELIKSGLLDARFVIMDHGVDLYFEGIRKYENEVLQLIQNVSRQGWETRQGIKYRYIPKEEK